MRAPSNMHDVANVHSDMMLLKHASLSSSMVVEAEILVPEQKRGSRNVLRSNILSS